MDSSQDNLEIAIGNIQQIVKYVALLLHLRRQLAVGLADPLHGLLLQLRVHGVEDVRNDTNALRSGMLLGYHPLDLLLQRAVQLTQRLWVFRVQGCHPYQHVGADLLRHLG